MMNRIIKIFMLIGVMLITATAAYADYHYASHDGSDEPPYTSWETAAHVVQDAADAASRGDTIYVGAGDYYGRIFLHDDSLALIGMGMDSSRVWYDEFPRSVISCDSITTIVDLFIEHTGNFSNAIYGGIYRELYVYNCRFEGGGVFGATRTFVQNCIFNGEQSTVHNGFGDTYLYVSNCIIQTFDDAPIHSLADTNIIINNIAKSQGAWHAVEICAIDELSEYDYIANNLILSYVSGNGIIISPSGENSIIVNNTIDTIYAHTYWEVDVAIDLEGDNAILTVLNNALTGGEVAGIGLFGSNQTLYANYNNIWGTEHSFRILGLPNFIDTTYGFIHKYPMFNNQGDDYHLQAFSPLIDAGDPNILDVDGTRSDLGCYGGQGGESYTYLDLPPHTPDSLSANIDLDDSTINLIWRFIGEADFNRYELYRDTYSGFEPSEFNLIAELDTSYYLDSDWTTDQDYYYRIASIDNQDNISDYSEELEINLVSIWDMPGVERPEFTAITSNYPNPFNSQTTIVYYVGNIGPIPAQINIDIYDILGRKVRLLFDARKEVGSHKIIWDGKDDNGNALPSGLYFASISQWNERRLSSKRKLLLVK
ncbi:MAG: T9SS type A sorting domain-containing protein [candidate division Zixibacteria bacterium]|nr:T9SS type A sorting domain-containing protein [candidate division Zixibacteria bacterium]